MLGGRKHTHHDWVSFGDGVGLDEVHTANLDSCFLLSMLVIAFILLLRLSPSLLLILEALVVLLGEGTFFGEVASFATVVAWEVIRLVGDGMNNSIVRLALYLLVLLVWLAGCRAEIHLLSGWKLAWLVKAAVVLM